MSLLRRKSEYTGDEGHYYEDSHGKKVKQSISLDNIIEDPGYAAKNFSKLKWSEQHGSVSSRLFLVNDEHNSSSSHDSKEEM